MKKTILSIIFVSMLVAVFFSVLSLAEPHSVSVSSTTKEKSTNPIKTFQASAPNMAPLSTSSVR